MKMNSNTKRALAIALAATMFIMPMAQAESSISTNQTTQGAQQGGAPAMPECTCENCTTTEPHICTCSGQTMQTLPEMPNGNGRQDGQTPSEKPSDNGQHNGQTPPEKPSDNGQQQDGQTPPEMPTCSCKSESASSDVTKSDDQDSDASDSETASDEATDETTEGDTSSDATDSSKSDSNKPSGKPGSGSDSRPDKPSGSAPSGNGGPGGAPDGQGGHGGSGFGGSGTVTNGTSATTIDEDTEISGETYESSGDDENALRIDGATVTLDGVTVEKSGGESSNTEDGDFYGQNAAVLALNGATVTITGATITTDAQNGNGVFSYGEGTTVNISDSTITTNQNNSGCIQTTGGGTTNASNLTVTTSGNSAAAIRSDRGGGTVNVDGGTYTTNGTGSPAVYSTADITVSNATLTANNSEAVVVEGQNSVALVDCDETGNMSGTYNGDADENIHNVMIYQSMSGDAEVGRASFSMTGGSLTSLSGDMIYVTNTDCDISLSGVELTLANDKLLTIEGNSSSRGWGTAGANGANVNFTADAQVLTGDITVDTISTLNMTMTGDTAFTGTINVVENEAGGTAVEDNVVLTIDEGCTWTLTGDCTLTSLTNNGTIEFNGCTITLADGTVLSE